MSDLEFGQLRSLLHHTPSVERFHALLKLAEQFNEPQKEEWLPYLEQQLNSWPDTVRECPQPRLKEVEQSALVWTPLLRHLNYESRHLTPKRIDLILGSTHLRQVTHLNMSACRFQWDDLIKLANAKPFDKLKGFAMRKSSSSGSDKKAIETLFHSPMFTQLESLSFDGWGSIRAFVFDLVAKAPFLATLKSLNFSGCTVSPKRFKALMSEPALQGLEEFHMNYQGINAKPGRLQTLTDATHLTNLRVLDFADFEPEELIAFSKAEQISSLRSLRLSIRDTLSKDDPDMDDDAMVTLFHSPHLGGLEELTIDMNLLKSSTLQALAQSPSMQNLHTLKIASRTYGNWGLKRPEGEEYTKHFEALLSSDMLSHLTSLNLRALNPDLQEFQHFVSSEHLQNLQELNLSENRLTPEHLDLLAHTESLQNLQELQLHGSKFTVEQIETLIFSGNFSNLRLLDLGWLGGYANLIDLVEFQTLLSRPEMPTGLTVKYGTS